MSLLALKDCRTQCRIDGEYDDALLLTLADAAQDAASAQLNRDIFPDADTLTQAQATLPVVLGQAQDAYQAALSAAEKEANMAKANVLLEIAQSQLQTAQLKAARIREGIVVNASIRAAMRLIVGHLYANREAVVTGVAATELPFGVQALLRPYRLVMMP